MQQKIGAGMILAARPGVKRAQDDKDNARSS